MTEICRIVTYEVHEFIERTKQWKAASYPLSKLEAQKIYQEYTKNLPDIKFRVVKTETAEIVIDSLEEWLDN